MFFLYSIHHFVIRVSILPKYKKISLECRCGICVVDCDEQQQNNVVVIISKIVQKNIGNELIVHNLMHQEVEFYDPDCAFIVEEF